MVTLPNGKTAGKADSVLYVQNPEQEQKLRNTIDDLTNLFKVFTCTVPSEKFSNFLFDSMVECQQNSSSSMIGSDTDIRECLIESSKRLAEFAQQELEFSAKWEDRGDNIGIEGDVMKIINKHF